MTLNAQIVNLLLL